MQSHQTGCFKGNRLSSVIVKGSWVFPLSLTTVNSTDVKLCTLPGSSDKPVAYNVRLLVGTQGAGTSTIVARMGTAANGAQFLNDVDLKAAAGTNYTQANAFVYAKADVDIWLRMSAGGTVTAGEVAIVVESFELNTSAANTLEA